MKGDGGWCCTAGCAVGRAIGCDSVAGDELPIGVLVATGRLGGLEFVEEFPPEPVRSFGIISSPITCSSFEMHSLFMLVFRS